MSLNVRPQTTGLKRSVSTPGTLLFNWRTVQNNNTNTNKDLDQIDSRFQLLSTIYSHKYSIGGQNNYINSNHTAHTMPDIIRCQTLDSSSPPINTIKFDFGDYNSKYDEINDVLRVAPEDLATQMTLIDLSIFCAIQSQELSSCQWNGSKKLQFSPNVVAFTQRFNRVSFWVIQEILSHKSVKHRAEVLSHFIKVAKRLLELNNLHSAYAVKSALTSAPIHRLTKTWAYLSKKDKQSFERLSELFSDSDNFERLRDHLSGAKTPCIPYLGMYLHDIVYIDVAHPSTRGLDNPHRKNKMDSILRIISEFQRSVYDNLPIMPNLQKYLLSVRYIEELQKFLEDDNYKLSIRLEPPESDSKSVFYVRESTHRERTSESAANDTITPNTSSTHLSVSFNSETQTNANSMPASSRRIPFTAGHRKAHSLGTNVLSSITGIPSLSKSLNFNQSVLQYNKNLCLIDDSLIIEDPVVVQSQQTCEQSVIPSLPTFEVIYDAEEEASDVSEEHKPLNRYMDYNPNHSIAAEEQILFQGMVKRKTVLKDGKKPSITGWVRYWLALQGTELMFYDPKHFKSYRTNACRSNPMKCRSLKGWVVALVEDAQTADTFTLSDNLGKNIYKFRAPTPNQAFEWYKRISQVLSQLKCSRNTSNQCLIDLSDEDCNRKVNNFFL